MRVMAIAMSNSSLEDSITVQAVSLAALVLVLGYIDWTDTHHPLLF